VTARRRQHLSVAVIALLLFALLAGAAGARASGTRFTALPRRLAQHQLVTVVVAAPRNSICSLAIRYADGRGQDGLNYVGAANGRAKWKFRIPQDAAPGKARVSASCRGAGSASRTVLVVGSVIPARIVVVKDGYSIRQNPYGGGYISYGVILKNTSSKQDALQVYAVVNFVGPDNKLVGTATTTVPGIPASQQFALGGEVFFLGGAPQIARLEVVALIQKRQPHALKLPTITNIRIAPSVYEPQWVGSVEGEVSNDEASLILQNTQLSTVLFDAAGNVIGGGSGYAGATLPPAARELFKIESGLHAVAMNKAASAMVSAVGTYAVP